VNGIEEPYALIAHVRFREGGGSVGCNIAIRLNTSLLDAKRHKKEKEDFATFTVSKKNIVINSKKVNNYFLNNSDLVQDFVKFAVPKR